MLRLVFIFLLGLIVSSTAVSADCCEPRFDRPLRDKPVPVREGVAVYRFTWSRSFNEPYVVRIERNDSGATITVRTVAKGKVQLSYRKLSDADWRKFVEYIQRSEFWVAPNPAYEKFQKEDLTCEAKPKGSLCDFVVTTDGAGWTLEGSHDGRYHWLGDRTPESGILRDMGIHILGIAGVHYNGPLY